MTKIVHMSDNFSHTPGAKIKPISDTVVECHKGTLYVNASGCTGLAMAKGATVVAAVKGAVAEQKHADARVIAMDEGAKAVSLQPAKPAAPVQREQGVSKATGSDNKNATMAGIQSRLRG